MLVVAVALVSAAPQTAAWLWLGAQWGCYLSAITIAASVVSRRKRRYGRWAGRFTFAGASVPPAASKSSLLRHANLPEAAPAAAGTIGSTADVGWNSMRRFESSSQS
jgi:hypothetical protein